MELGVGVEQEVWPVRQGVEPVLQVDKPIVDKVNRVRQLLLPNPLAQVSDMYMYM